MATRSSQSAQQYDANPPLDEWQTLLAHQDATLISVFDSNRLRIVDAALDQTDRRIGLARILLPVVVSTALWALIGYTILLAAR